jgi:magnesium-transporting ATPase (P-type)
LNRKPDRKSAPLITLTMWKMIIGQAIYQLVVTFVLNFGGESILSYQSEREKGQLKTLVFNTFVWMQIFNQYKYVAFPRVLTSQLILLVIAALTTVSTYSKGCIVTLSSSAST